MVQFRRQGNAHWYHETQSSGSRSTQVNDEHYNAGNGHSNNMGNIAEQDIFLLGLMENISPELHLALVPHQRILIASDTLYQTLFPAIVEINHNNTFSLYDRLSSALTVAQVTGVQRLCSHYAARLTPLPSPDASRESNIRLTQITQYARQLASQPTLIDKYALEQLAEVGLTDTDIILLSQIIGYVGYQARVVAGLSALARHPTVMLPGFPRMEDAAPSPLPDLALHWQGWLPSQATNSEPSTDESVVTLAKLLEHHPHSFQAYNVIAAASDAPPLQRDWLELLALVSARIHGSLYCLARHGQYLQPLADNQRLVTELLKGIEHAQVLLPKEQIPHWLIWVAAELTRAPERFSHQHLEHLTAFGISDTQVIQIIFKIAATGWTNRLRQTLGIHTQ